jgi:hypothetical protein
MAIADTVARLSPYLSLGAIGTGVAYVLKGQSEGAPDGGEQR